MILPNVQRTLVLAEPVGDLENVFKIFFGFLTNISSDVSLSLCSEIHVLSG